MSTPDAKRVRSLWFVLTGAAGGAVGFLLMAIVLFVDTEGRVATVILMAFAFSGFGLAVGGALGATEGLVKKNRERLLYGLKIGALLGAVGGLLGGAAGQLVYGLAPVGGGKPVDVAIALDSSGSMGGTLWFFASGNDPNGQRIQAAIRLIDRMGDQDRVAVVDFDGGAQVLHPLAPLGEGDARARARLAVGRVDSTGGTNLDAGLRASLEQLVPRREEHRRQHVIFLTDGDGYYDASTVEGAAEAKVTIHTIGLGAEVNDALLQEIAHRTGGQYHAVQNADQLVEIFDDIYAASLDMASYEGVLSGESGGVGALTWIALWFLRIVSWSVMGLVIGAGQGVRENTREDLQACSIGGMVGGAVGGALFNPIAALLPLGAVLARALGTVVVGAAIGGSMRLMQQRMVDVAGGGKRTSLSSSLPRNPGLSIDPGPGSPG